MSRRLLKHVPDRARRRLRHAFIPDEASLVYQAMKHHTSSGTMLDVGACIGSAFSRFANDGWKVYAFEPDPVNRNLLSQRWSNVPGVLIDQRAVSNSIESDVPFYRSDVSAGISGLSSFHASHRKSGTVDTITLEAFCRERQITDIDFLKVDTEGHDLFVLQGVPWSEMAPRVVMCEFEDSKTIPLGYDFHDLATYLLGLTYHVLISEWYPITTYGASHRWRRFGPYPGALLDQRAWGNIIAVRDRPDFLRLLSVTKRLGATWKFGTALLRLLEG